MRYLFLVLTCFSFLLTGYRSSPNKTAYSRQQDLLSLEGQRYLKILRQLRRLQDNHPHLVKIERGRSTNGHPLWLLVVGKDKVPTKQRKRPAIYISGAIHGGEYMNIVDRLPQKWLSSQGQSPFWQYMQSGGLIYIVPIANPDGFMRSAPTTNRTFRRRNGNGVDLNRDFPLQKVKHKGLSQRETIFLTSKLDDLLEKHQAQLALTFDYHCCLQPGRLLFPWGFRMPSSFRRPTLRLSEQAKSRHLQIAAAAMKHLGYRAGNVWNETYANGQRLGGVIGASDDYFFEKYFDQPTPRGAAFTFEGQENEHLRFTEHLQMWQDIFAFSVKVLKANKISKSHNKKEKL